MSTELTAQPVEDGRIYGHAWRGWRTHIVRHIEWYGKRRVLIYACGQASVDGKGYTVNLAAVESAVSGGTNCPRCWVLIKHSEPAA